MSITAPTTFTTNLLIADNLVDAAGRPVTTTTTSCGLELQSTLGALCVSRMTNAEIQDLDAVEGMIAYNTTTAAFNFYQNDGWVAGASILSLPILLDEDDILSLRATPVTVVPAPGEGKAIYLHRAVLEYVYNGDAYTTTNTALGFLINDSAVSTTILGTGFMNLTEDRMAALSPVDGLLDPSATYENQPLVIQNTGSAEFLSGDGDLKVTVFYSIINL